MKPNAAIVGLGINEWSGKLGVGSLQSILRTVDKKFQCLNPDASGPNSKRVLQEENLSIYLIKKPKQMRDKRWETD